ncbi:MAG: helix-turn-helix domain-containing protein [Clostridiales bacterium]|jgi:transcriptional regulator with XRE-family HTH domain|nr:helix-turn-helix domain-containing protein [Clostridiales bacterium]
MGRPPKNRNAVPADSAALETERMDSFMMRNCGIIGANIRHERKLRSFSIEDLSEYLELSPSYVGLLERGERCPSLKSLLRICQLFSATPNELLLERENAGGKSSVAEPRRSSYANKIRTVESIVKKLSESELDFVITTMKGLKNLSRNGGVEIAAQTAKEQGEQAREGE